MKNLKISFAILILWSISANAQYNFSLPDHFRSQRNLPLIDLPTSMDIKVVDYGAKPNDGKDDGDGIMKALELCKKFSKSGLNVRLVFEKGTYDLFTNKNNTHLIELNDANNILIDGNGAEIIIHDPLMGFFSII